MQPGELDSLAGEGRRFLVRWRLARELRSAGSIALLWMFAGPLLLLLLQWLRSLAAPPPPVSFWLLIALAPLGPMLFVVLRLLAAWRGYRPGRQAGLALFDAQLRSHDRLVTADEFLREPAVPRGASSAFMQAAVEDAGQYAVRAAQAGLAALPLPAWTLRPVSALGVLGTVAVALILLFGASGAHLDEHERAGRAAAALVRADLAPGTGAQRRAMEREQRRSRDAGRESTDADQSQSAAPLEHQRRQPGTAAQERSITGAGATAQSAPGLAGNAAGSAGEKSAESGRGQEGAKGGKNANEDLAPHRPAGAPSKQARLAAGAEGERGTSAGERAQESTSHAEQRDPPERGELPAHEADGSRESVKKESMPQPGGTARPELRDRKPPRNRTNPSSAGRKSDPRRGRGGPGPLKKTRGVPSMILGVPVADRIQGKPNPGPVKVTQVEVEPAGEAHAARQAQQRRAREEAAGPVSEPQLLPWMQALVRDYFVGLRAQSDAQSPHPSRNEQGSQP